VVAVLGDWPMRKEWGSNEESTFILHRIFILEEKILDFFTFFFILVFA